MVQTATPTVTQPRGAPPPPQGPQPLQVGSDIYDWHTVNQALIDAGMNGWSISGQVHTPVNVGQFVRNPAYNAITNPDVPEVVWQEGKQYVIGVVSPDGTQMTKVTLIKGDPDQSGNYKWSVVDRETPTKIDTSNEGGYSSLQRLPFRDGREEVWGINKKTGAFEKLPNQPTDLGTIPKGWNDIRQIESGGKKIWVGTSPEGKPLQPVPGAPEIPVDKYVPGSVKQVTVTQNGQRVQVWRGQNPSTGEWEDIPTLGTEPQPIQTTTVAGTVYKQNPKAGQAGQPDFLPVTGITQAKDGDEQWVPVSGGYLGKQVYHNGTWSFDPGEAPRPYTPEVSRAAGAILPKGTPYNIITTINGESRTIRVIADGNGGYTIPDDVEAKPIKGAPPTTKPVTATSTDEEFITRYNPDTGKQETVKNPNYAPTASGDRVRQLRELAAAKQQELHDKIGTAGYTAEQANKDFNDWWDTEIEPRRQQLQFDQDQLLRKNAAEDQAARATAMSTAQGFGAQAVSNYQNAQRNMVGPGFAESLGAISSALSQRKNPPPLDFSDVVYKGPDPNDLYAYYTAQALRTISPTAAAMFGGQPTAVQAAQGMDLNSLVNRSSFLPTTQPQVNITIGAGASGGGAPVAAPVATPAPSLTLPAPATTPSMYTPPGNSSYAYPTAPWNALPGPAIPNFSRFTPGANAANAAAPVSSYLAGSFPNFTG